MKKSGLLMALAFVLAIVASSAFKPASEQSPLTLRYHVVSGVCTSFTTSDCDGAPPKPVCTGVYANIDADGNCNTVTYHTN